MTNKKNNIIIISVDNLRSDCLGPEKLIYKKFKLKNKLHTPILDSLVTKGLFFDNCYTTAPYTTNAHASILTGCWPYRHEVIDFISHKLVRPTVLEILKQSGYSTLFQADFHFLLGENLGFDQGVDKYVKENEKESFDWIRKNKDKPLACFFHFANIHSPYGFFNLAKSGRYYRVRVEQLLKKYKINSDTEPVLGRHFITSDLADEDLVLKQNYQKILDRLYELGDYDSIMDLYIEGINFFEKHRFKSFVDNLKKIGIFQNSVIVLMGDHGEVWDKDNQGHAKGNMLNALDDDVLRVPLLFFGSGEVKYGNIHNNVRTIDMVPTILGLAGVKTKNIFDGINLFGQKNKKELDCYSHIWEADSAQVTLYMNKLRLNKASRPSYKSFLKSATLKKANFRFTQNYDNLGKVDFEFLLDSDGGKINIEKIKKKFRRELLVYNQKTKKTIDNYEISETEIDREDLRNQLRSLGYKI